MLSLNCMNLVLVFQTYQSTLLDIYVINLQLASKFCWELLRLFWQWSKAKIIEYTGIWYIVIVNLVCLIWLFWLIRDLYYSETLLAFLSYYNTHFMFTNQALRSWKATIQLSKVYRCLFRSNRGKKFKIKLPWIIDW